MGPDVLLPTTAPDREGPLSVAHQPQLRGSSLYEYDATIHCCPYQCLV